MKFNGKKLAASLICLLAGTLGIFIVLTRGIGGFWFLLWLILHSIIIVLGLINTLGAVFGKLGFFKKCGAAFRVLSSITITLCMLAIIIPAADVLITTIINSYNSSNILVACLLMGFALVEWIALLVFNSLAKKSDRIKPRADFICSSCGKEYDVRHRFCPACGGNVIENRIVMAPAGAVCSRCGHVGAPGDRFCSVCGGDISRPAACPSCGRPMGPGEKFCPDCGAAVINR